MADDTTAVLLIEVNPADVDLIKIALRSAKTHFAVCWSESMSDALHQLAETDFDVILANLRLPDCSGLEVIAEIRQRAPSIPIVVLTGLASDEVALESLEQGAQDYLVKDSVTNEVLQRTIRYAISRQQNAEMRRLLAQVKESQELLKKKNRGLGRLYKTAHRFVDNVSHEFRTPLTVIKEYVALLSEGLVGEVNEEQIRMLHTVEDRADDLNTMVDDMLDVSKLEAGMLGICRKNSDIAKAIEHVRPNLDKKAIVKNVNLEIDVDDNLPEVYCDAEKVGRVIVNLTVNAIKFSGQPGHVRLWAKQDESSHDVVIGVTDNGQGIDPQSLAAIFERFRQLVPNPRGSTKGFGLGLNIAKELVDLNFGQMNVESEVGRGSTFSFTVPIAQPTEIMRRYLERIEHLHNGSSVVSLVVAQIDDSFDPTVADDVDSFLNYLLRRNDLLFRADTHRWLVVLPTAEIELDKFFARVTKVRDEANRNRPHGPLPKVESQAIGTWKATDHMSEILACTSNMLMPLETIHV